MADRARRSPAWHRDEIILALDLYVRGGSLRGGPLPSNTDPAVIDVSRQMNALPIWREAVRAETFRNPAGVALKLANFRAIERVVALDAGLPGASELPTGMKSFSVLDRVVFEEFWGRWQDLQLEAAAIWAAAGGVRTPTGAEDRALYDAARDAPLDGGGVAEYEASAGPGGSRSRGEAELVRVYGEFMVDRGHDVTGRHYRTAAESRPLRADLMVRDLNVLVEAKATDARHAVRMAIGQLHDYRRFEHTAPGLAVLLPREPVRDLTSLLDGLDIGCVWPRGNSFADTVGGRLTA
jgi:hypothetical protein